MDALQSLMGMDIYLIDQVMKGRYREGEVLLDAGCGSGRNLAWFAGRSFNLYVCDQDPAAVAQTAARYALPTAQAAACRLDQLPWSDAHFDHIICSAVLHFAADEQEFTCSMAQLARVLKPGGSLFIRMCTLQGLPVLPKSLGHGRYLLNDGTERFVLDPAAFSRLLPTLSLAYLEPPKAVNVNNLRSMSVVVLKKEV